ncbi:hypothetical protein D3C77_514630 [compost metagenome]
MLLLKLGDPGLVDFIVHVRGSPRMHHGQGDSLSFRRSFVVLPCHIVLAASCRNHNEHRDQTEEYCFFAFVCFPHNQPSFLMNEKLTYSHNRR